ncbi:MAG: DUF4330 family protein [Clostridia bacterium]|nr:DUF4330 family protein [Clostridia bacterium]
MQTKQKTGPRFNIFDVLIILAVISCIAAIVVKVFFIEEVQADLNNAEITFIVENVSEGTAEAFCVPDRQIYLQDDDTQIGTLQSASYSAQKLLVEDAGGKLVEADHPTKKQIQGVASMSGYWSEDGFLIGGTHLATVGSTFKIYTKDVACTIKIVGIAE